ncbi:uroporphyrinogen-III synthase [Novosphingobium sp. G106]|uniref:uroporphyrinogen-III synthase n=1 Tax=Novosphingobium sp. G106 TaxID=2849500 RepID=UPI001C2D358C|nr:uroporphyrinogen-III synthase [Novosphingobium sp. G106]MBV1692136.1 uroporphyrinogen-III synthase [Novosphingobium sp. G106]
MLFAPDNQIWVTRTAPFNQLTARHLKNAGLNPLLAPALQVVPLRANGPMIVPDALVFTSLQGVRHHPFLPSLAHLPVFAVGGHTARMARLRGYKKVTSAWGDVHDLRKLICAEMPFGATIMHLSAAQPAGDLVGMLSDDGYQARRRSVYKTMETNFSDLEGVAANLSLIGTILIHSPRAGWHVAQWLEERRMNWSGIIYCISPAASEPFKNKGIARVSVGV